MGDEYSGPWAHPSKKQRGSLQRKTNLAIVNTRKDDEMQKREDEEKRKLKKYCRKSIVMATEAWKNMQVHLPKLWWPQQSSTESLRDYQGRGWTHPPPGIKARDLEDSLNSEAYVPKMRKEIHGAYEEVNAVEFLPGTGHLLLSRVASR